MAMARLLRKVATIGEDGRSAWTGFVQAGLSFAPAIDDYSFLGWTGAIDQEGNP
jgi:hypothetical protein